MKPILLAIGSSIMLSLAQVLLALTLSKLKDGELRDLSTIIKLSNLESIIFCTGFIMCGALGVAIWIAAIKHAKLTDIYWTTSICYIIVPALSYCLLAERISIQKTIGYTLIAAGIAVCSRL